MSDGRAPWTLREHGHAGRYDAQRFHHSRKKKDYKRVGLRRICLTGAQLADEQQSGKMRAPQQAPESQSILLPRSRAPSNATNVSERTKDSRLQGADLYVARLGLKPRNPSSAAAAPQDPTPPPPASRPLPSSAPTGSLHDELRNPEPAQQPPSPRPATPDRLDISVVRASRPCYRCVGYMHAAGIKRVFWTTDQGAWESRRVRDLVDALDGAGQTPDAAHDVFVTKYVGPVWSHSAPRNRPLGSRFFAD